MKKEDKIYKIIEYWLYTYNQLDSMIYEIEDEFLCPTGYTYDKWIQSQYKDTNTLENQVIRVVGK